MSGRRGAVEGDAQGDDRTRRILPIVKIQSSGVQLSEALGAVRGPAQALPVRQRPGWDVTRLRRLRVNLRGLAQVPHAHAALLRPRDDEVVRVSRSPNNPRRDALARQRPRRDTAGGAHVPHENQTPSRRASRVKIRRCVRDREGSRAPRSRRERRIRDSAARGERRVVKSGVRLGERAVLTGPCVGL